MSNVYTVFNTTSEHEFSKFFDDDFSPNNDENNPLLSIISTLLKRKGGII